MSTETAMQITAHYTWDEIKKNAQEAGYEQFWSVGPVEDSGYADAHDYAKWALGSDTECSRLLWKEEEVRMQENEVAHVFSVDDRIEQRMHVCARFAVAQVYTEVYAALMADAAMWSEE